VKPKISMWISAIITPREVTKLKKEDSMKCRNVDVHDHDVIRVTDNLRDRPG
jgi:hypothetical protein